MQGYTVSSRYDSDDYDDLLALSCDACSEQVRQAFPFFLQVMIDMEASSMHPPLRVTHGNCYSQATCTYAKKLFNELDWRGNGEIQDKESPLLRHCCPL